MTYSEVETQKHPLTQQHPNCLIGLDALLHREDNASTEAGCRFGNGSVIDLDAVETEKARCECRGRTCTMDCSFAIQGTDGTRMLLVEIKLNHKNPNNLRGDNLIGKVEGSISLLGASHKVHPKYVFIFKSELRAHARNRISRIVPRMPNNYIVMDVEELEAAYFKP